MYILQISDLHISKEFDQNLICDKLEKLLDSLKILLKNEDKLLCCILGDVIDKGEKKNYDKAYTVLENFFARLNASLEDVEVKCEILPGNHDLCKGSLLEFNKFASKLLNRNICYSDKELVHEFNVFGYHFVSLCSIQNGEHKFGQIDFESIPSSSITSNSILLTHHALISSDKNDHAAMRGGYDLIKILETNNVIALLHGHTHGCKRYSVGHDCQIIGVGPMFKQIDDISNQCNLIHIKGNYVKRILTLTYHDDRKIWDKVEIYEKNADNNYYGDSVGKIYDQVLHDAKANLLLPNLRIQIKQEYSKFENEIKQRFSACMEDAKAWQSSECPDNLEYTHGQLMNHGGIKWEQHIVDTLVKNPTSKRAVIPLIDKDMVYKGGDDRLVSFDVVQFGFSDFDSKDLYITLYMRALEIKHFLPLNLCEMYLMAERIRNEIRTIKTVTICIFSFKAEIKQVYGCYKKSQIDIMSESALCKIIAKGDLCRIKELLKEKLSMGDSVIELEWLEKFRRAVVEMYECDNAIKVKEQINNVKTCLLAFKEAREKNSDYSITQKEECEFINSLELLSKMFGETKNE